MTRPNTSKCLPSPTKTTTNRPITKCSEWEACSAYYQVRSKSTTFWCQVTNLGSLLSWSKKWGNLKVWTKAYSQMKCECELNFHINLKRKFSNNTQISNSICTTTIKTNSYCEH